MLEPFRSRESGIVPYSRTATSPQESKKENLLGTACSWGPAEAELEREEMPLTRTKAVSDTGELGTSQELFFTKGTPIK